ncbi:MAG: (d)CMP kinase [Betaproteobacteria bacterium]|nr:(d)CMP kinase [Betaproteobacteria bacterium]
MTRKRLPSVIAIDGPTASGKGTVAAGVAAVLGFHYLDSGALYRVVGLAALRAGVRLEDGAALAGLARRIAPAFVEGKIVQDGEDITLPIRAEDVSRAASQCAVFPAVRQALLERQRAFRQPPGLVADGRDMGSVVFPDALLKVYLTAGVGERAQRRHKQLIEKGIPATIDGLLRDLKERDARDSGRADAPLAVAPGALVLDTTGMSIIDAIGAVVAAFRQRS